MGAAERGEVVGGAQPGLGRHVAGCSNGQRDPGQSYAVVWERMHVY
jgi:hypothetical protein